MADAKDEAPKTDAEKVSDRPEKGDVKADSTKPGAAEGVEAKDGDKADKPSDKSDKKADKSKDKNDKGGKSAKGGDKPSTSAEIAKDKDGKPKVGTDTVFTGELLRQVRESQRITLKEISERTRISVMSLSALENEKYEDLPNARVYVRGFVRCLAVEIGLDRDQVSRTYLPRWEAWAAANADRVAR
ncbi:helix-turn-helix domain-containing protein [Myxococcota bacterium]|nr:helix-turn-helix domain-containing protein [Myxococcota bacterium]